MNKERTILITALLSFAVCLSACGGAKKDPVVSETSSVITTVPETTQSSETEAETETEAAAEESTESSEES